MIEGTVRIIEAEIAEVVRLAGGMEIAEIEMQDGGTVEPGSFAEKALAEVVDFLTLGGSSVFVTQTGWEKTPCFLSEHLLCCWSHPLHQTSGELTGQNHALSKKDPHLRGLVLE